MTCAMPLSRPNSTWKNGKRPGIERRSPLPVVSTSLTFWAHGSSDSEMAFCVRALSSARQHRFSQCRKKRKRADLEVQRRLVRQRHGERDALDERVPVLFLLHDRFHEHDAELFASKHADQALFDVLRVRPRPTTPVRVSAHATRSAE